MLNPRSTGMFTAGLLFAAIAAFGQTAATSTSTLSSPELPPVGLAPTETAQVNVVNTMWPDSNGGIEPYCNGTITFYSGGPAGTAVAASTGFLVRSGEVFSVPLSYAATGASGMRTVIRAAIVLTPFLIPTAAGPVAAPCSLAASLETFDTASGVTHVVVSGATHDAVCVSQAKSAVVR